MADHLVHVDEPLARDGAVFAPHLAQVRQVELLEDRRLDRLGARPLDVAQDDVLAPDVAADVAVVRQVVGRRGMRPQVAGLDEHPHHVGHGRLDLPALVALRPGHPLLEVKGLPGQRVY